MADKYLVVVDMQNDFVTGALGTEEARAIVAASVAKVRDFTGKVIFTQDTHGKNYLQTQEGRVLPVEHCVKGMPGWQIIPELKALQEQGDCPVFQKGAFGSVELARYLSEKYQGGEVGSVELIGVCTDICVVSNALLIKAFMPELPVYVDAACCAGVTPQAHEAALATMRSCQVSVLS